MVLFEDTLRFWVKLGLLDVVLPFILIFTIVYALLQRTKVLGEKNGEPKQKLNAMVALVVGLASVAALQTVTFVQKLAQWSAIAVVVILGFWIVLGLVGVGEVKKKSIPTTIGMIIAILFGLYSLGAWNYLDLSWLNAILIPVLIIIFFIGVIWFIAREQKTETKPAGKKGTGKFTAGEERPVGPSKED